MGFGASSRLNFHAKTVLATEESVFQNWRIRTFSEEAPKEKLAWLSESFPMISAELIDQ